jgi:DNA-binding transcriptional LysR family regulator
MPLILCEAGGNTRGMTDTWFRRAGLVPRRIMELGSVEAIKVLVGSGLEASALLSLSLALHGAVAGAITRKLKPAISRDLGIVSRSEKAMDRCQRLFLAELNQVA